MAKADKAQTLVNTIYNDFNFDVSSMADHEIDDLIHALMLLKNEDRDDVYSPTDADMQFGEYDEDDAFGDDE